MTPIQARHYFARSLHSKDKLFITPVVDGWGWAEQGLPDRMVAWLHRHLGSEKAVLV
jgi:hypothetical protein